MADIRQITGNVVKAFGRNAKDVTGDSKSKTDVRCREMAVYIGYKAQIPVEEIGAYFGKRSASAIQHLFERAAAHIRRDDVFESQLRQIAKTLDITLD